jgi:hypothetical protein
MKRLIQALSLGLLTAASLSLAACTTSEDRAIDQTNTTAEGQRINPKPWSRPERWEGQGPLGSIMQQQDPAFY